GRRTADDDPLEPSRLLFCADPETVAARAKAFFAVQEPAEEPGSLAAVWKEHKDRSAFVVRKPPPLAKPITSISVTSFRSYLACPYRFYLQHVLGLRLMDDRAEELSAPAFGTLVHAILRRFGEDDSIKRSTDADEIRRFLRHALNQHVAEWHGTEHLPAVDVQIVQAQARLDAFAQWQAGWSAQGWEIVHTETPGGKEPATLRLDRNLSVTLRGRIDRIDHNAGRWAVFDYKTSDKAETPQQTHFKSGQWIDLQLPLYRHLVTSLEIEGPVSLGYIVVPKDVAKTGELMADWDESTLAGADEAAVEVATAIARGVFWPPADPPPRIMSEFGAICQESAFQPLLEGAEEEEPA
ncbi:MAG: PD-(D/E)XK nuclease family protein, partial [Planctomycetes bacterium]|nr:PD-(D/E)XK nuclease family protein [Planctomycetota bacterium]